MSMNRKFCTPLKYLYDISSGEMHMPKNLESTFYTIVEESTTSQKAHPPFTEHNFKSPLENFL